MKFVKRIVGIILAVAVIASIFLVWFQRQEIMDWLALRDYKPPTAVVVLADKTSMTTKGRKIFYVNHPEVAPAKTFNSECSQETSIVLGCYIPGRGIYIFDVTEERLQGVKEVTSAHEMLHAAYDRLSNTQRNKVDKLTQDAYIAVTNQRVRGNVENYRKQDPNVVPNELHSILATEVTDLPADLEAYYKQYFINRKIVVAFSDHYEAEFTARKQRVDELDKKLETMKQEIDESKAQLDISYNNLKTEKNNLNILLNSGQVNEYNLGVPSYNNQVNDYNNLVKQADVKITDYNNLVAERNSIAGEVQDLAQAIDSRPQRL